MLGGGGADNCPKKYNIDYFGYAANLEVKFKLNFDEERGSKIEKKVKYQKTYTGMHNFVFYTAIILCYRKFAIDRPGGIQFFATHNF